MAPLICELLKIALSFIDHVVVIGSEYCDTGVGLSENLKSGRRWVGYYPTGIVAHHNYYNSLYNCGANNIADENVNI